MKLLAIIMIINSHEISLTLLSSMSWFSDHIDLANLPSPSGMEHMVHPKE